MDRTPRKVLWIEPRERYYGSNPAKGVEVIHSRSLSLTRSQISSTPSAWNYRLPGYISASSLKFLADAALLKSKITFSNANIEPHKGAGRNPFVLTVANALTGFFRLPCLRSQSDDFYYYSTKKARTFKTEHWIYLNSYKTDNISSHSSLPCHFWLALKCLSLPTLDKPSTY